MSTSTSDRFMTLHNDSLSQKLQTFTSTLLNSEDGVLLKQETKVHWVSYTMFLIPSL